MASMSDDVIATLPIRLWNGHKGTFGTVLVVAGQATMIGAPCFVAVGALRIGCGLVRLALPPEILSACLGIVPSAIGVPRTADHAQITAEIDHQTVIAAGPGLGLGSAEESLIHSFLQIDRPLVIDGDGLTHLSKLGTTALKDQHSNCKIPRQAPLILTPHPGEYARLASTWGTAPLRDDASDGERKECAKELAIATQSIVVLKGHGTVVSDGVESWTCTVGNPALAIPGSGDVLTGIIAGLLSQGLRGHEAAILGVHLHGLAGDRWAEQRPFGMLALELAALIPEVARNFSLHRTLTALQTSVVQLQ